MSIKYKKVSPEGGQFYVVTRTVKNTWYLGRGPARISVHYGVPT